MPSFVMHDGDGVELFECRFPDSPGHYLVPAFVVDWQSSPPRVVVDSPMWPVTVKPLHPGVEVGSEVGE